MLSYAKHIQTDERFFVTWLATTTNKTISLKCGTFPLIDGIELGGMTEVWPWGQKWFPGQFPVSSYQSFYWPVRGGGSADYLLFTLSSEPWLSVINYRHQGYQKKEKESPKRVYFAHKMWPWENKAELQFSHCKTKNSWKKSNKQKTHERWRADNPLRSDESTQASDKSTRRTAQRWQKTQIHLKKKKKKWPTEDEEGKKRPQKNQTRLIPCYSGHFLQQKCFFFHLFFFFCVFFLICFSSTETCTKNVQHEAKKAVHNHRREGKRKNPQNCIREEKKTHLEDLFCFSFCKLEEKKRSFRCSLCL